MPAVVWKNINVLRGLAIFLVVVHHATVTVFALRQPLGPREASALTGAETLLNLLGSGLSRVCVPAFLFASGFLLFRFCRTWKGAWGGIRPLGLRYLAWSLGGYAIGWAIGKVEPGEILPGVLSGGPFTAYWFVVLIIQLYLLSPLLVRWVEGQPFSVVAALIGLQLAASGLFYLDYCPWGPSGWPSTGHLVFFQAPFYLLGMLFSARLPAIQPYLVGRKPMVAVFCLVTGLLLGLEGVLLGRLKGPAGAWTFQSGGQSLLVVLFSLGVILAVAGCETRPSTLRRWCDHLGARSLGILFTVDIFLQLVLRLFWQGSLLFAPGIEPGGAGTAGPAPWVQMYAVWLLPVFVLAGLFGPLLAMRWTGILFGRKARTFLFG